MLPLRWLIRFLCRGIVGKFLHRGSVESVEKFLHYGSVERVLYSGSMDDCANPLLGIKHHNDSYPVVVWRSSYTMEVWKRSYIVEAWTIVLIRCWVSSTIIDSWNKRGEVPTLWKCGDVAFERADKLW
nr:hypothetical protein CFP56_21371 [Quercus suber]